MLNSAIALRGCIAPVEPTDRLRPSVKASDCSWQDEQENVWLPDSRVS